MTKLSAESFVLKLIPLLLNAIVSANILDNDVEKTASVFVRDECYGSVNRFGISGSPRDHYGRMRARYSNCTYLRGNLEITFLDSPNVQYDFGFLSTIRVITGYVLIVGITQNVTISLDSLTMIRADSPLRVNGKRYGLFVGLNYGLGNGSGNGLQQLRMPNLREISNGDVYITKSPHIPYVTTVDWSVITPTGNVVLNFTRPTPVCANQCNFEGRAHCWGPGIEDCQAVIPVMDDLNCHPSCPGRCFRHNFISGCCPDVCAGGCWGPENFQCWTCKYVRYGNTCLNECPAGTFQYSGVCHERDVK